MGQPPLGQDNRFSFTDVPFAEIISLSLGNRGAKIRIEENLATTKQEILTRNYFDIAKFSIDLNYVR